MNPVEWLIYAAAYDVLLNRHVEFLKTGRWRVAAVLAAIDVVEFAEAVV